jgi:predicted nucleotide-binding protein
MLDFVRRVMLGEKTSLPTKVWIVHGSSHDWKILKKLVEELGVEVDEFNEISVAGIPISERWKQMASEARFAFALLTRDDQDANGNWLPRLNVAHEIGLCHARLGIESTAILREGDVTVFSNLQGINYLHYETGKLEEKKAEIGAILKERGVL